jgi:FPC/CPF motif-containing protein YcgG
LHNLSGSNVPNLGEKNRKVHNDRHDKQNHENACGSYVSYPSTGESCRSIVHQHLKGNQQGYKSSPSTLLFHFSADIFRQVIEERKKKMQSSNALIRKEIGSRSTYLAFRKGKLVLPLEDEKPAPALAQFVHNQLRSLILNPGFACVGAQSALNQGTYRFGLYQELGSHETTTALFEGLRLFVHEQPTFDNDFTTFIASFVGPVSENEEHFETLLWQQLQQLHDMDTTPWDSTVSSDPRSPRFSFSIAGLAFFVVGLHSGSARWTRRFAWPTLVFNVHAQFEHLREKGRFERFQQIIRTRDQKLQGNINSNLTNFGDVTDARQYSGRPVGEDWHCPMHVHPTTQKEILS